MRVEHKGEMCAFIVSVRVVCDTRVMLELFDLYERWRSLNLWISRGHFVLVWIDTSPQP